MYPPFTNVRGKECRRYDRPQAGGRAKRNPCAEGTTERAESATPTSPGQRPVVPAEQKASTIFLIYIHLHFMSIISFYRDLIIADTITLYLYFRLLFHHNEYISDNPLNIAPRDPQHILYLPNENIH